MLKKIFYNKQGFTLIELMVILVVTVVITTVTATYIRGDINDEVDLTASQLLSDIRGARNLAVSRATYDFNDGNGNVYPAGGYGVTFVEGSPTYRIFADKTGDGYTVADDGEIKAVTLDNPLQIADFNNPTAGNKWFIFKSEDDVTTNFSLNPLSNKYEMAVNSDNISGTEGVLILGEVSADNRVFVSLGLGFRGYTAPNCLSAGSACEPGGIGCCDFVQCNSFSGIYRCENVDTGGGGGSDTSCFPAGTKILMADNSYKNIEDVKIGDYVLSYDENLGEELSAEVLSLVAPIRAHMCELTFVDSSLQLTNEHPVYTKEGWKSINPEETFKENEDLIVNRLVLGDEVFFVGDVYKEVAEINCWQEKNGIQTYNLKNVEGFNTFFAEDILVHNAASGDCTIPLPDIPKY